MAVSDDGGVHDALGFFHSGATSDGTFQNDPALCLGGFRGSHQIVSYASLVMVKDNQLPTVIIDHVHDEGNAELIEEGVVVAIDTNKLAYEPPVSGEYDGSVTIADGETKVLNGKRTPSTNFFEGVRVTRDGDADFLVGGRLPFRLVKSYNNAFAMSNVSHTDRLAGCDHYRGIFLYNRGFEIANDIKLYLAAEGTGCRIGWESVGGDSSIQTIPNETTAPGAISWNTGTTVETGLSMSSMSVGGTRGVWIHREVSADADAGPIFENQWWLKYTIGGNAVQRIIRGLYRRADTDLGKYEIRLGIDEEPDLSTAPDETSPTLPFSVALTPPGSGEREYYGVVSRRDYYDLMSLNLFSRKVSIDSEGAEVVVHPSSPTNVIVTNSAGSELAVTAKYNPNQDDDPADTWLIYTGCGEDPDPEVDAPIETTMVRDRVFGSSQFRLDYDLGPYGFNVDVHVLVRAKRSGDGVESENIVTTDATTNTMAPRIPYGQWFIGEHTLQRQVPWEPPYAVLYIHEGYNIRHVVEPGISTLWADTTLVWRLKYTSEGSTLSNGLWTTFVFHQTEISGAASDTPVDVVNANEFYITVKDQRRLKIDVSQGIISCAALSNNLDRLVTSHDDDPISEKMCHTLFQVWDRIGQYETVASLGTNGRLTHKIPWRQRSSVEDFE